MPEDIAALVARLHELIAATRDILAEATAPTLEYRPPFQYTDEGYNEGPALLDANGKAVACFFWPCHPPEATDAAVNAAEHLFALFASAPDVLRQFCDLAEYQAREIERLRSERETAFATWWDRFGKKERERAEAAERELAEARRQINGYHQECREVEQTLGKALGYPWYRDDQKNFPGSTEADGVCVGEHVPSSIASEAANKLAEARRMLAESDAVIADGRTMPGRGEMWSAENYWQWTENAISRHAARTAESKETGDER